MVKMSRQRKFRQLAIKYNIKETEVRLAELMNQNLSQALSSLAQKEVGARTAFAIAKIIDERASHIKDFESAKRIILDSHCEKDEKGEFLLTEDKTKYIIKDEPKFEAEMKKLTDIEVKVSSLPKHELEKLSAVSAAQLLALMPLIKE